MIVVSSDRTVRFLHALGGASTSRVLNLGQIARNNRGDPDHAAQPMFRSAAINTAFFLKHRMRSDETYLFNSVRSVATKIIVPFDLEDLRAGGRSIFIEQRGFIESLRSTGPYKDENLERDLVVLRLLNTLPSLDPFLLREHLKRNGFEPARPYFAITDADILRMYEFVRDEVLALVTLSAAQGGGGQAASRLVDKLLSSDPDNCFEPLKETLRLNDKDYQDGVFCWRGFLYYKWVLSELTPQLGKVLVELATLQPRGAQTQATAQYLPAARRRIEAAVTQAVEGVNGMLGVYDKAYRSLTLDGQPTAFRDFLLAAPDMFMALGEQSGAVQHIVSFWRYRFPPRRPAPADPEELMDIFLDFEDGLAFLQDQSPVTRVA